MAYFITCTAKKVGTKTLNIAVQITKDLMTLEGGKVHYYSWGGGYDDRQEFRSFWEDWYNNKPAGDTAAGRVVPGRYTNKKTFMNEVVEYLLGQDTTAVNVATLNDKLESLLQPEEGDIQVMDAIADKASVAMDKLATENATSYEDLKKKYMEDRKGHNLQGGGMKNAPVLAPSDPITPTSKPSNQKSAPVVQLGKMSSLDLVKYHEAVKTEAGADDVSGMWGKRLWEPVPQNKKYDADVVYEGYNNSGVMFSRDEHYVLRGHTRSGAAYLYAGRSPNNIETETQATFEAEDLPGDRIGLTKRNDLISDAAYLYLSQKADSDALLQIPVGTYGEKVQKPRTGESLAALKADGVAIMSRKSGIRLVAPSGDLKDSKGGLIDSKFGIDLISGNGALEPLVKGDSLHEYLKGLSAAIDGVASQLYNFLTSQIAFNAQISTHRHGDPFCIMLGQVGTGNPVGVLGGKNLPDIKTMLAGYKAMGEGLVIQQGCIAVMRNQVGNDLNGLQPPGANYFLSKGNRTN